MNTFFKTKSAKGYFLAVLAAISVSNVFIFSKAALTETPIFTFGFYWFLCAFTYNFIVVTSTGKIKLLLNYSPKLLRSIAIIAFFESIAAFTFFLSIQQVENPAIASFLVNTVPVFVILISIPLLNERFNKMEAAGIFVTLIGAFMLSYSGQLSFEHLFVKGASLTILACMFSAVGLVVAKKNIKNVDPYVLSFTRSVPLVFFYLFALIFMGGSFQVSGHAFMNMALGSFFGPFVAAMLQYNAFRYIEVSKQSLVQNTNGLFVLFSAWLYLGLVPQLMQFVGGFVTILGAVVLVLGKLYYEPLMRLRRAKRSLQKKLL